MITIKIDFIWFYRLLGKAMGFMGQGRVIAFLIMEGLKRRHLDPIEMDRVIPFLYRLY